MTRPFVEPRGHAEFDYLLHRGTAPIRAQWYFREQNRLPVAVQRWTFPPGGTEGVLGDRGVDLGPGDALLAPAGVPHGVRNDGPEPAEFVVVWGQPGTGVDWGAARMGLLSAAALDRQTPDAPPDPPEGTP